MDTGTIRHWPRIAREELVKIFPNGRTVHIPADGHPLPGYALALADVERQGAVPSGTSLEAARAAGVITASQEQAAAQPKRSLLARIFGIGKVRKEPRQEPRSTKRAAGTQAAHAPMAVASLSPPHSRSRSQPIVPLPAARPKPVTVASILPRPRPAQQPIVTAAANGVFDNRGYWPGAVETGPALPAPIANGTPFETASLDPVNTASTSSDALAYATERGAPLAARARPMGSRLPRHAGGSKRHPGFVQRTRAGVRFGRSAGLSVPTARGCAPPC